MKRSVRVVVAASAAAVFVWLEQGWAAAAAAVLGAAALFAPAALARLERVVVRSVGAVLAWALLAPVFYLVVTPFGLLFRRGGRSRLTLGPDPGARSYWRARGRERSLERPY